MEVVNTEYRAIPDAMTKNGQNLVIAAVCTVDHGGNFAVYIAVDRDPAYYSDIKLREQANWIAYHGQKQRWEEATTYFPHIPEARYRS